MRILVIEDEIRIQAFLARGLEAEGYAVAAADNGRDGVVLATTERRDLVVLDLLLPGINGLPVLRETDRTGPELPVVILSARSDLATKLRGFELGARDYVPKPFSLEELVARVRVQLRRRTRRPARRAAASGSARRARPRAPSEHGSATRRRPVRPRVPAPAPARPAPGEVVSRERLLAEVWGYHFDPGSNVVDVCVRRLRQKLGTGAPIETVGMPAPPCCGVTGSRSPGAPSPSRTSSRCRWPGWETIPFHFIWISLTLVYGFRVWNPLRLRWLLLGALHRDAGALIIADAFEDPALGRALRGAADVGDVPRDGLARAAPPGGDARDTGDGGEPRAPARRGRSGSCTTPRTSSARR